MGVREAQGVPCTAMKVKATNVKRSTIASTMRSPRSSLDRTSEILRNLYYENKKGYRILTIRTSDAFELVGLIDKERMREWERERLRY